MRRLNNFIREWAAQREPYRNIWGAWRWRDRLDAEVFLRYVGLWLALPLWGPCRVTYLVFAKWGRMLRP